MKKNIFIFGSSGFIGSYLVKNFLINYPSKFFSLKYKPKLSNNLEIKYQKFWKKILSKSNIIIYLSFNNDLEDINKNFRKNLTKTLKPIIELKKTAINLKKKIKIVYLSSASIYGNKKNLPVKETSKVNILNSYDLLKYNSEKVLIEKKNKFIDYQILRLSNVYGPNLSKRNQKNRQILTKIILNCLNNNKLTIYGNGKYYRDYVHVADVCKAILKSTRSNVKKNQIYNIGSGQKIYLKDIFLKIVNYIDKKNNKKTKIIFKDIKKKNIYLQRNYQADIKKANINLGWKPDISLSDGIKKLIEFIYEKNN